MKTDRKLVVFFLVKGFIKEKLLLSNVTYIHPTANTAAHDLLGVRWVFLLDGCGR